MNEQTPTPEIIWSVLQLAQLRTGVDWTALDAQGQAAAQYLIVRGMIHRGPDFASHINRVNFCMYVEKDPLISDRRLDAPAQAAALAAEGFEADRIAELLRARFPYMTDPYFDAVAVDAWATQQVAQDKADAQTSAVFGFTNLIDFIKRDSARTRPAQPELAELCANPGSFRWVPGSNFMRVTARNGSDASSANPA
jgi:hypothetical protein